MGSDDPRDSLFADGSDDWLEPDDGEGEGGEDADRLSLDAKTALAEFGYSSALEVTVDFNNLPDDAELRGGRFASLEDAILFLAEIGLLSFAVIVQLPDNQFSYAIWYQGTGE